MIFAELQARISAQSIGGNQMSKAAWMAVAVAMTDTGAAWARIGIADTSPVVCLSYLRESVVPFRVLVRAKAIVVDRYAAIGVRITSGSCQSATPRPAMEIHIHFIDIAPAWLQ